MQTTASMAAIGRASSSSTTASERVGKWGYGLPVGSRVLTLSPPRAPIGGMCHASAGVSALRRMRSRQLEEGDDWRTGLGWDGLTPTAVLKLFRVSNEFQMG